VALRAYIEMFGSVETMNVITGVPLGWKVSEVFTLPRQQMSLI